MRKSRVTCAWMQGHGGKDTMIQWGRVAVKRWGATGTAPLSTTTIIYHSNTATHEALTNGEVSIDRSTVPDQGAALLSNTFANHPCWEHSTLNTSHEVNTLQHQHTPSSQHPATQKHHPLCHHHYHNWVDYLQKRVDYLSNWVDYLLTNITTCTFPNSNF